MGEAFIADSTCKNGRQQKKLLCGVKQSSLATQQGKAGAFGS